MVLLCVFLTICSLSRFFCHFSTHFTLMLLACCFDLPHETTLLAQYFYSALNTFTPHSIHLLCTGYFYSALDTFTLHWILLLRTRHVSRRIRCLCFSTFVPYSILLFFTRCLCFSTFVPYSILLFLTEYFCFLLNTFVSH